MDAFISLISITAVLFSLSCVVYIWKETVKGMRWLIRHLASELEEEENTGL